MDPDVLARRAATALHERTAVVADTDAALEALLAARADALVDAASADVAVGHPVLDGPVLDDTVLDGPVLDDAVLDGPVLDDAVLDGPVLDDTMLDGRAIDRVDAAAIDEAARADALDGAAIDDAVAADGHLVRLVGGGARRRRGRRVATRPRVLMLIAAAVLLVAMAAAGIRAARVPAGQAATLATPVGATRTPVATIVAIGTDGRPVQRRAADGDGTLSLASGVVLHHLAEGTSLRNEVERPGVPGARADAVAELELPTGTTLRFTLTDTAPSWPHTTASIGGDLAYTGWCDYCPLAASTPARHAALQTSGVWLIVESLSPDPEVVRALGPEPADEAATAEPRQITVGFDDLTSILSHATYDASRDARQPHT